MTLRERVEIKGTFSFAELLCRKCPYGSVCETFQDKWIHDHYCHSRGLSFNCPKKTCDHVALTPYAAAAHLGRYHIKWVLGKPCVVHGIRCPRGIAKNGRQWRIHLDLCVGAVPYKCNLCDYLFRCRSDVEAHIKRPTRLGGHGLSGAHQGKDFEQDPLFSKEWGRK